MFSFLGKVFMAISLSLGATAVTSVEPAVAPTNVSAALTPEEISTRLHDEITGLREQIEKDKIVIVLSPNHPPRFGDRGPAVEKLQELLLSIDLFPKESVTGYFGPLTKKAVEDFNAFYQLGVGPLDSSSTEKIIDIGIEHMNLASLSFPEENVLLGYATSSAALITSLESSAPPDISCPDPVANTTVVPATLSSVPSTTTSTTTSTTNRHK